MNEKQWVQYKNDPNGTKWEVHYCNKWDTFYETVQREKNYAGFLPKSDYIPCDPPEVWEEVTSKLTIAACNEPTLQQQSEKVFCGEDYIATLHCKGKYRIRLNPFKVEKKVS